MIIFLLAVLLIAFFIFDNKNFIFALMVFFLLFDMFDGFYKDVKIFAAIRYVVPFVLITIYAFVNKVFIKSDWVFLVFSLFLFLLLLSSPGDFVLSGKTTFSIIIAVYMLIIGRHLGETTHFMKAFEPFTRFMLLALPMYIIFVNIFKIGESYTSSFYTGFLETSRMYILPILIFVRLQYVLGDKNLSKMTKSIDFALIGFNIVVLMVTTRRTSLAMLLIAIVIYAVLNREIVFKMLAVLLLLITVLAVSFPLYEQTLNEQLARRERIQNLDTYENEGRFLETIYLWHHHKVHQNPRELFFGVQLFDTEKFGNKYFGNGRPIHSDINMVLYSTGIIGFLVFVGFFYHYLGHENGKIKSKNKQIFYPLLAMFLLVIIPGRFIGTFTFAPLLMLLLSGTKHANFIYRQQKINFLRWKAQNRGAIPMSTRVGSPR